MLSSGILAALGVQIDRPSCVGRRPFFQNQFICRALSSTVLGADLKRWSMLSIVLLALTTSSE